MNEDKTGEDPGEDPTGHENLDLIFHQIQRLKRRVSNTHWVRDTAKDTKYHRKWRARNREHYNAYHRRYRKLQRLRRTPH